MCSVPEKLNTDFILETTDNVKVETTVSIDKALSMFQEFSSNEVNNNFGNYLYTIEKKIKEDNLKTGCIV